MEKKEYFLDETNKLIYFYVGKVGRIELRSSHLCEDGFVGVSKTVEQRSFLGGVEFVGWLIFGSWLKRHSLPVRLI